MSYFFMIDLSRAGIPLSKKYINMKKVKEEERKRGRKEKRIKERSKERREKREERG
jgi:hypothetical protein